MTPGIVRCKRQPDPDRMARPRRNLPAARLRAHLLAGRTRAEIAAIEGLTVDQVKHRKAALGLVARRPLPPAPEILALIESAVSRVEIARRFGCSPAAVTLKLKRAEAVQ